MGRDFLTCDFLFSYYQLFLNKSKSTSVFPSKWLILYFETTIEKTFLASFFITSSAQKIAVPIPFLQESFSTAPYEHRPERST
jgi:hypothetical protein